MLPISTGLSKERPDSQTSHWPAQVVSKELCISIAISTLSSQAMIQTGAICHMHTELTDYHFDGHISVSRLSCNNLMEMHEVVEEQKVSTECDRSSNSFWTQPGS
jgi:hypothetical protein